MSKSTDTVLSGPCPICGEPRKAVWRSHGRAKKKRKRHINTCGRQTCIDQLRFCRERTCTTCGVAFRGPGLKYCRACSSHSPGYHQAYTYGLTVTELNALKAKVNGLCEVCGAPGTDVDHDHKTGKVRGWLCGWCNRRLFVLEMPDDWQAKARAYLARTC